ncbi:unnamed protein product [Periconia digitata]|uniref:Uncharacterized protein n=1 Tax=Periconia digitata TaxID=1303443 RepID=A0A9W4XLY2_9PLEO|nr:unnamed protein product [Periconia digitata]
MQSTMEIVTPVADEKERLFQCSTCQRSFTRIDHLMRHVRSHTKEKPYICPTCEKGFARIDLLKRHSENHKSKRARKEIVRQSRVVQACEECSNLHLRCTDDKPCTRCLKKNITCRVASSDQNTLDAAQGLLEISHHPGYDPHSQPPEQDYGEEPYQPPEGISAIDPSLDAPNEDASINMSNDSHSTTELPASITPYVDGNIVMFDNQSPMDPLLPDYVRNMQQESCLSGFATPRNAMDLSFNWDMDFTALDFGMLDQFNTQGLPQMDLLSTEIQDSFRTPQREMTNPDNHDDVSARAEVFKDSVWKYQPSRNINPSIADESHIALSDGNASRQQHPRMPVRRVINERLASVSRDKLLALILSSSNPSNLERISSGFPSLDLLDGTIQKFFTAPSINAASWFHVPTFSLATTTPELLSCIVAAGAFSMPDVALQKLGLAFQEASMTAVAKVVQHDNSAVRNIQFLQVQMLQIEVATWSGINRKMEIAESFFQIPVTMLRRGGRFRHYTWKNIVPDPNDSGSELQKKWQDWVSQESWVRLAHRYIEFDCQSSIALLKTPLIQYSEMQLPIPCSDHLWYAPSASAWKTAYLANPPAERPNPHNCLHGLGHVAHQGPAHLAYLYVLWGMIFDYRQMLQLMSTAPATSNSLLLPSRCTELLKLCEVFRVSTRATDKHADIMMEVLLMHIYVPMDDIQTFAGIAGPEEARHSYPALRDWAATIPARQGLWHAGQVIRLIESLPKGTLRNFYAMMVYHAGLVLWSYGMLRRPSQNRPPCDDDDVAVRLNCEECIEVKRFITFERGQPMLRRYGSTEADALLSAPSDVIVMIMQVLQQNHDAIDGALPSLVESLLHLLLGLRSATQQ